MRMSGSGDRLPRASGAYIKKRERERSEIRVFKKGRLLYYPLGRSGYKPEEAISLDPAISLDRENSVIQCLKNCPT